MKFLNCCEKRAILDPNENRPWIPGGLS